MKLCGLPIVSLDIPSGYTASRRRRIDSTYWQPLPASSSDYEELDYCAAAAAAAGHFDIIASIVVTSVALGSSSINR